MKSFFFFLIVLAFSFSISAQQANPCASEQHRQFDFWVGEWEVKNADDQVVGNSKIELILNNCVIMENWTSASPGYSGKSFNYFNPFTKEWNQKWIDSSGIPIEFSGTYNKEDQAMYYTALTLNREGKEVQNKLSFYKKSNDYVNQVWEQSFDYGKTWATVFDGHYRRKKVTQN